MANRVTGTEVKEIINTSLSAAAVEPFITPANLIVTGKCSSTYSAAELKEIERWLAAHFVAIRDPSLSAVIRQQAGKVSQEYLLSRSNITSALETTPYGQQALAMDYQGTLAGVGGGRTATLRMFGAGNEEFDEEEDA